MTSESDEKAKQQKKFTYLQFKLKIAEISKFMKVVLPVIKPYFFALLMNYALSLAESCVLWFSPMYMGGIIDIVTRSKDSDHLWSLLRDMTIFALVSGEISSVCYKVNEKTRKELSENLKTELYRKILDCDLEFFDQSSPSEAREILDDGMNNLISLCFSEIKEVLLAIFGIFGNLYSMYFVSPELANIILVTLPLRIVLVVLSLLGSSDKKNAEKVGSLRFATWLLPFEAIQNIFLVKCFSTEDKEHKEYIDAQKELRKAEAEYYSEPWYISRTRTIISEGLNLFLIYRGGQMVFDGKMTAGDLSMFNMYATTFASTVASIHSRFQGLYETYEKSTKTLKLLEKSSKAKDRQSQNFTKPKLTGNISVNNVSFRYPAKPEVEILHDLNLKINAGESVAFVGVSGSGKTTLSYLLQNLYTPTEGRIFIDGEDIRDYDINWLHHNIGYVSQEPVLLYKTVEQNIAYGLFEEYSPEQVDKALTLSNSKFILNKEKFPDGLKTKIGDTKLSGGQKQRIAIARAFIKDPKILILDEPTSALDGESESKVQKAIDDLIALGDRTVIIVAHRLSTIINCHKIVVFDDGKIVEQGTHKELIAKDGAYKKLFEFQINSVKNL